MYQVDLKEAYFPAQPGPALRDITVGEGLREAAADRPDRLAISEVTMDGDVARRWTYAQLLADSERLAGALATRYEKGERIVVWAPNIPEWVLLEYAFALAGLVLVTANPAFQPSELRYVIEQSGAVALFLTPEYRGNPMAKIAEEAVNGLNLREVVDMRDEAAMLKGVDNPGALPEVGPNDAAQIQYTSGTTGFPKGAVLSHQGLMNNAFLFMERMQTHENTKWSNHMPMFHTSGCAMAALGCLQYRCEMFTVPLFDPNIVLDLIEREGVTAMTGVPTMVVAMLQAHRAKPRDLSSIEIACCGGAMVAPELARAINTEFGCRLETVYGQTESSPVITLHHATDSLDDICNTIGQPLPHMEVSIRRVKDNSVADIGEVGEICARSYATMIEYNANEKATSETVDADGWLHTGDLGTMDTRGYTSITGRVKEMIIRGGENYFPAEIERVILEHAAVAEVAVVGLPDPKWGEIIACFIRAEDGQGLDVGDLHAHCREHLAPQKTPAVWCEVDEFPLTGSGKIQKFALRDGFEEGAYKPIS